MDTASPEATVSSAVPGPAPVPGSWQADAADASRAAAGDFRAFERLYHAHTGRVHALARRHVLKLQRERHVDDETVLDALPACVAGTDLTVDFEAAILRLPPGARQGFVLHDVEGYKHEEIAALLGVRTGTTKAQLHRARMILRAPLDR